ncbi:hypothetical protein [Halorhabdus sp. CBA1104]|uniref:PD-(D/E)XK nuclease domain-containing protein n=1 Tax=Halorhabdus sp. CBA1104 TaxID=1380432 RepID=UPI0012B1A7C0|nr:hypothetical protein [Halorhabdus sp. CBA1104]
MTEFFGRQFSNIDKAHLRDLHNLEMEGCVYTQLWRDEVEKFGFCRIRFEPDEIVKYVDSLHGYDEFLGYVHDGYEKEEALEKISDERVKSTAREYAEWAKGEEEAANPYCPAAFFLEHLEDLLCGGMPDRYEFMQESYTGDRRFLLSEIFEGFSNSLSILQDRDGDRPDFELTCETDFQDLLYAIMKPIFPDARPEEYTPKHGTNSKRIDFVIPEISTVIEAKYVRDSSHANKIPEELKVDIESYHAHTDCQRMYGLVWDADSYITDVENFEKDLTGPRTIDGNEFQVEVKVLP